MENNVICGDSLNILTTFEDNSFDAIITDPPYELGFMSKKWDKSGISFNVVFWKECLRVLKPGAHMLVFGGTRTYHRIVCAIEDAGFEVRDMLEWVYGSGFPKNFNISKSLDKRNGVTRQVIGIRTDGRGASPQKINNHSKGDTGIGHADGSKRVYEETVATSPEAKLWDGFGTALKPSHEPICLVRKPLEDGVVDTILKYGTGALNIDECRVPLNGEKNPTGSAKRVYASNQYTDEKIYGTNTTTSDKGRFPANLIHDGSEEVLEVFPVTKSGDNCIRQKEGTFLEHGGLGKAGDIQVTYGDRGSAARFFYCAKASKKERGEGNTHPTVKPLALMDYLIKLIVKPGQKVLDPFCGSGTTLIAAKNYGCNYIGIDQEEKYCSISEERLRNA